MKRHKKHRAVVLLSGGVDSATILAVAKSERYEPYALTFEYGQKHAYELQAARKVGRSIGVAQHEVVSLGSRFWRSDALTGPLAIPKLRTEAEMASGVPPTYVPARNTVFLSIALGWAETIGAHDIFIGACQDDAAYPDCRRKYIRAFEQLARLGPDDSIRISAPLLMLPKSAVIRWGLDLGVDYSLTSSCYDAKSAGACAECDACQVRRRGFRNLGVPDPIAYRR